MEFTFEAFEKRKMEKIKGMKNWETVVQGDCITTKNKQDKSEYHYQYCEQFTERMRMIHTNPCLVYHVQFGAKSVIKRESYNMAVLHNEKSIRLSVLLKSKERVHRPIWVWHKLDEKGIGKEKVEETTELESIRQSLVDAIKEMPEFRLYAVTGDW